MNKLKVIYLNLILFLGVATSLGFGWNNQQDAAASTASANLQNNGSETLAADSSGDKLSNTQICSQDNCTINAAGGCAGCGTCSGQNCFR